MAYAGYKIYSSMAAVGETICSRMAWTPLVACMYQGTELPCRRHNHGRIVMGVWDFLSAAIILQAVVLSPKSSELTAKVHSSSVLLDLLLLQLMATIQAFVLFVSAG